MITGPCPTCSAALHQLAASGIDVRYFVRHPDCVSNHCTDAAVRDAVAAIRATDDPDCLACHPVDGPAIPLGMAL